MVLRSLLAIPLLRRQFLLTDLPILLDLTWLIIKVTAREGPLRITPSVAAGALGFGTADFSMELTETGIKTSSYSGEPSNVSLSVDNLTGQVLSMTGLPSEDFIVLLDSNGAKRLASRF